MSSMCRSPYIPFAHDEMSCPSPVEASRGYLASDSFTSLMYLWSRWTLEYMEADFPRLIVRYEDLLFTPEVVVQQVCSCLGGTAPSGDGFKILESVSKWGGGHRSDNRSETMQRYSTKGIAARQQLSEADLNFIRRTVDESVVDFFHYSGTPDVPLDEAAH